jgi:uncharacterized protein YndB with AHSA1/START domain
MSKSITHSFYFEHAPEKVWKHLTDTKLLGDWLMPNDFKAEMSHQFQFKTKPKTKFSFDGTVYGEVLEIIPQHKLVYTWQGGSSRENISLDSVVTWTLSPKGNGTELMLEQSGFTGIKNYLAYVIMNMGWVKISKRLRKQMDETAF